MFLTNNTPNLSQTNDSEINQALKQNSTYAYLYDGLKKYFLQWYLPLVIALGFLGSAFCLVFLTRSHIFPKNLRIWLISICIGDFLILAMEGVWMMLKVWYGFDIRDVNDALCVLHITFSNYMFYWSAYVQCFVSMQRCYLVLKPFRVNSRLLSAKNLLLCLLLVSLFLVFPILPYAIYWRVIDGDCDPVNDEIFRLTTVFDLVFWGIIPVLLMTTSTVIIWRNLLQRRNRFNSIGNFKPTARLKSMDLSTSGNRAASFTSPKRHSVAMCRLQTRSEFNSVFKSVPRSPNNTPYVTPNSSLSVIGLPQLRRCSRGLENLKRKSTSEGSTHVTLVLICMNFVYMASVYPLIIYFLCLNFIFSSLDHDIHRFIYYLFRSFCFLNACSNWIFYCVAGGTFRKRTRQLVQLVCCRRPSGGKHQRYLESFTPKTPNAKWCMTTNRYSCSVYRQINSGVKATRLDTAASSYDLDRIGVESSNTKSVTLKVRNLLKGT